MYPTFAMEPVADRVSYFTTRDLQNVFAYSRAQASASVIKVLRSQPGLVEHECTTDQDWETLVDTDLPSIDAENGDSGLVLLIAPRTSRTHFPESHKVLTNSEDEDEKNTAIDDDTTVFQNEESLGCGGTRQTRVLPFSQDVFLRVSKALYTHRSIARVINRVDVPLFSYEEVSNLHGSKRNAWVYNCRSTNSWGSDLAMTLTHFPHCGLSFGILFGCTAPQKKYILQRLNSSIQESSNPLLLPGIFAEIESKRHHVIFEAGISKLESMIPDSNIETLLERRRIVDKSDEQDKRAVYLDMLHLKHELVSWSKQLEKMMECALATSRGCNRPAHQIDGQVQVVLRGSTRLRREYSGLAGDLLLRDPEYDMDASICREQPGVKLDSKIARSINTILEDYSNKIRECQMRFDGLTMTTQLFQGETSLLLALATSKDSRHMRTIALVTMVFLPGTFIATVFSMTFFNWQANDEESVVSPFIWVYIALSLGLTAITLLAYFYFIKMRSLKARNSSVSENYEV